jgi:hypothetical protein
MKHLHLKRTTIMVMISIVFLAAGYAAAVKEQQPSTGMSPGFPDREGMPPMAWGTQWGAGEAAQFESNIDPQSYSVSVSGEDNPLTYYDAADIAGNYSFQPVKIKLEDAVFLTDDLTGLSIVKDEGGTITIKNRSALLYEYVLTGTLTSSVVITSDGAPYTVTLSDAHITGTTLPALQLKSTTKAFINLAPGSANSLGDSPANSKKGALTSSGDVIFTGSGALTVTGTKKHAIKTDGTVRISDGDIHIITTEEAEGNGIHSDDAFIMDDGKLTIEANGSVYGEEGKGIKVNGRETDREAKGYLVINGGTVTITAVGKAMTAGWKIAEDAETETTDDDPTPDLIVNNGVITITTTGKPYEVSDDESLSPEGLEAKRDLIINGGLIQITTTDDALNAGSNLVINGGMIFAHSSEADALDSNGTLQITGGTLIALGSQAPEMGIDCDHNSAFTYTGGTVVAMGGGGNNTPDNAATTGHVVTYGDALHAGESFALTDSDGSLIIAFTIPSSYTFGSASLMASSQLVSGEAYTLRVGGTLTSSTVFNGLALSDDQTYTGGSEVGTVVMDSAVSHLGSTIRMMGMDEAPGFGGGPGVGTPGGQFREPPQGFPGDGRPPM